MHFSVREVDDLNCETGSVDYTTEIYFFIVCTFCLEVVLKCCREESSSDFRNFSNCKQTLEDMCTLALCFATSDAFCIWISTTVSIA